MDMDLLRGYIAAYEEKFDAISHDEIYKWQAVQWFQDHWDIEAADFAAMLDTSLKKTSNLLSSGAYFPRRMIIEFAEEDPTAVREAFRALFDEERDLMDRITSFQATSSDWIERHYPRKKHYQGDRAVLVYLVLRYPDSYYLYKWSMFVEFARKTRYDYKPGRKKGVNVIPYLNLCERLREEIVRHDSLLKRHHERIGAAEYADESYHLLTQDFIYAVTKYLDLSADPPTPRPPRLRLTGVVVEAQPISPIFKGQFVDYVARHRHNTRIGNLGEDWVLQEERLKHGDKVSHDSLIKGDGLGYDILSVDDDGGPKYIEVKTTAGKPTTSFYISRNELARSREVGERYYLYRLYNFDEAKGSADYYVLRGDLSRYCINPTQFEVSMKINEGDSIGPH